MKRLIYFVAGGLMLSACGGGSPQAVPATETVRAPTATLGFARALFQPIDPAAPDFKKHIEADQTPQLNTRGTAAHPAVRPGLKTQNTTNYFGTTGVRGIELNIAPGVTAVSENLTVFPGYRTPSNWTVIAPTLAAPPPAEYLTTCYIAKVIYTSDTPVLEIEDACTSGPPPVLDKVIDSTFTSQYLTSCSGGQCLGAIEMVKNADGTEAVLLYNWANSRLDIIESGEPFTKTGSGTTLGQSDFNGFSGSALQTCISVPATLQAVGISINTGSGFRDVNSSDGTFRTNDPGGCFSSNGTNPPYYYFSYRYAGFLPGTNWGVMMGT